MKSFRRELWVIGAGGLSVILVGLAAFLSITPRRSSSPLSSRTNTAAASSEASKSSTSIPPHCRTSQLTLRIGDWIGFAGGSIILKQLHNTSHEACSIQGTPRVHTFVTAHPSEALPVHQEITYAKHPMQPVILAPDGWASFYESITAHHYDRSLAAIQLTTQLRLPGAVHPIVVETSPGGDRLVSIFVSGIYPGKYPSNTPGIQWSNSGHPPTSPPLPAHRKKSQERPLMDRRDFVHNVGKVIHADPKEGCDLMTDSSLPPSLPVARR